MCPRWKGGECWKINIITLEPLINHYVNTKAKATNSTDFIVSITIMIHWGLFIIANHSQQPMQDRREGYERKIFYSRRNNP
jgi:hypothetical protein